MDLTIDTSAPAAAPAFGDPEDTSWIEEAFPRGRGCGKYARRSGHKSPTKGLDKPSLARPHCLVEVQVSERMDAQDVVKMSVEEKKRGYGPHHRFSILPPPGHLPTASTVGDLLSQVPEAGKRDAGDVRLLVSLLRRGSLLPALGPAAIAAVAQSADLFYYPSGTVLRARASAEQAPEKGTMWIVLGGATVAHQPGEDSRHTGRRVDLTASGPGHTKLVKSSGDVLFERIMSSEVFIETETARVRNPGWLAAVRKGDFDAAVLDRRPAAEVDAFRAAVGSPLSPFSVCHLSPNVTAKVVRKAFRGRVRAGTVLARQGDPISLLAAVLSGQCRASLPRESDAAEARLALSEQQRRALAKDADICVKEEDLVPKPVIKKSEVVFYSEERGFLPGQADGEDEGPAEGGGEGAASASAPAAPASAASTLKPRGFASKAVRHRSTADLPVNSVIGLDGLAAREARAGRGTTGAADALPVHASTVVAATDCELMYIPRAHFCESAGPAAVEALAAVADACHDWMVSHRVPSVAGASRYVRALTGDKEVLAAIKAEEEHRAYMLAMAGGGIGRLGGVVRTGMGERNVVRPVTKSGAPASLTDPLEGAFTLAHGRQGYADERERALVAELCELDARLNAIRVKSSGIPHIFSAEVIAVPFSAEERRRVELAERAIAERKAKAAAEAERQKRDAERLEKRKNMKHFGGGGGRGRRGRGRGFGARNGAGGAKRVPMKKRGGILSEDGGSGGGGGAAAQQQNSPGPRERARLAAEARARASKVAQG